MSASSDSDFIGSSLNRFAASPPWQMQTRYRKSPAKLQRIERLEHQCRRLTKFARMQRHKSANERHLNGVPLRNIWPRRRQRSIGILRASNGFSEFRIVPPDGRCDVAVPALL